MKVEGKSRYAICEHVNAAHRGTQVFHAVPSVSYPGRILQKSESKAQHGHAVIHWFQLNNDSFVAGASGKMFTIQIFEQRYCVLT
jgi:hypothetical protein